MAIENIMMETGQVVNFAVCCTSNLPISTINHFFTKVHQQERKESATPVLTFVHDLSAKLWGPTKQLRVTDERSDGILYSPFTGCDGFAIQQMLQQMKKTTGSAINTHWFLVLNHRSEGDDTAVIVNVDEGGVSEGAAVRQVRVAFGVSSQYLAAASIAHPGIDELIEFVENEGSGVLWK